MRTSRPQVLVLLVLLVVRLADTGENRRARGLLGHEGVMSKVRAGLDAAGRLLGLDTARGVANLVTSSLKSATSGRQADGVFAGFFRILGFDASKLGAIALNGLIFLAQMISNSLTGRTRLPEDKEEYRRPPGSPLTWILNSENEELRALVDQAQDRSLPDQLVDEIRSLPHHGYETPCTQLLVCKAAPFVWGMQDALGALTGRGNRTPSLPPGATALQRMWAYLPDKEALREHGDECEERFPQCSLLT